MNDLENNGRSILTNHQQLSELTPVSLHFNQAGHSINDVILIPLELVRSNRDAVRKARQAHFYTQGTQLSPLEIKLDLTKLTDVLYHLVSYVPITIHCFYCHISKFLFVTNI